MPYNLRERITLCYVRQRYRSKCRLSDTHTHTHTHTHARPSARECTHTFVHLISGI